jgi:adenosylcobyric acid synthase
LQSFGLAGERINYRQSVDQALDELAGELASVLDKDWLDRLLA